MLHICYHDFPFQRSGCPECVCHWPINLSWDGTHFIQNCRLIQGLAFCLLPLSVLWPAQLFGPLFMYMMVLLGLPAVSNKMETRWLKTPSLLSFVSPCCTETIKWWQVHFTPMFSSQRPFSTWIYNPSSFFTFYIPIDKWGLFQFLT